MATFYAIKQIKHQTEASTFVEYPIGAVVDKSAFSESDFQFLLKNRFISESKKQDKDLSLFQNAQSFDEYNNVDEEKTAELNADNAEDEGKDEAAEENADEENQDEDTENEESSEENADKSAKQGRGRNSRR